MAAERLQKILAKAGISSRRKAEELIQLGEVTVNGQVAKLGDKAELGKDAIKVKGKLLQGFESKVYLAFNKPKNVISTLSDPEGRPSLGDYLKQVKARVYPIGRLDFTSEGLLLLTNDGDLAEQIQKRDDIARVYHVKVKGHPDKEMLARLERGARIGNKFIKPHSVRLVQDFANKALVRIVMTGSGAVDVKEYFETRGFLVEKIIRVAIGHLTVRGMDSGQLKHLTDTQVKALIEQPELGLRRIDEEDEKSRPSRRLQEEGEEIEVAKPLDAPIKRGPRGPRRDEGKGFARRGSVKGPRGFTKPKWDDEVRDRGPRKEGGFGEKRGGFGGGGFRSEGRPKRGFGGPSRGPRPAGDGPSGGKSRERRPGIRVRMKPKGSF